MRLTYVAQHAFHHLESAWARRRCCTQFWRLQFAFGLAQPSIPWAAHPSVQWAAQPSTSGAAQLAKATFTLSIAQPGISWAAHPKHAEGSITQHFMGSAACKGHFALSIAQSDIACFRPARWRRGVAKGESAGAPSAGTYTGAPRLLAFGRRAAVAQISHNLAPHKIKRKVLAPALVRSTFHQHHPSEPATGWMAPAPNPSWAGGWLTAPRSDVWIARVRDAHKQCRRVWVVGWVSTATATRCS